MTSEQPPVTPPAVGRVFGDRQPLAERYHRLLATLGIERGLIGPREVERLWERHILNSVALADLVPRGCEVCDVGSGAGLPGIPLAIARPDLRVTLLEPLLRRSTFLGEAVDDLGLGAQVTVVRGRAEETAGEFDVVTSRAVAPLTRLLPWCLGLLGDRGELIALKGSSAADEVREVGAYLAQHGLRAEVLSVRADAHVEPTTAVRVRRS